MGGGDRNISREDDVNGNVATYKVVRSNCPNNNIRGDPHSNWAVSFSGMGRLLGGTLESAGVGNLSGTAWLTREREQDDGGNNSGVMLYVELCSSSTDVELSCF